MAVVQKKGQELGQLGQLGSPVLSKVKEAFLLLQGSAAQHKYTASLTLTGFEGATLFVGWNQAESLLVLTSTSGSVWACGEMTRQPSMVSPPWLAPIAKDAHVQPLAMKMLDSYLCPFPNRGSLGLACAVNNLTGGAAPRRVVSVGYCIGGAVATLAAAWAGVQWPTADVRCITFGAPAVGNAAFVAAFRWLVGISYRVVFRRDPIPSQSVKPLPAHSRPHHVHGAIYLFEEDYRPGAQPKVELTQADLEDHHLDHYSGAVAATCKRHYKRQVSTGGVCRATFDKRCMAKWCPIQSRAAAAATVQAAVDDAAARSLSPSLQPPSPPWDPTRPGDLPRVPSRQESLDSDMTEELELDGTSRPRVLSYLAGAVQNGVQDSAHIGVGAFKSLLRTFHRGSSSGAPAQGASIPVSPEAADSEPASPEGLYVPEDGQSPRHMFNADNAMLNGSHARTSAQQTAAGQPGVSSGPHQSNDWSSHAEEAQARSTQGTANRSGSTGSAVQSGSDRGDLQAAVLQDVRAYGSAIGVTPPNAMPVHHASSPSGNAMQSSIGSQSTALPASFQQQLAASRAQPADHTSINSNAASQNAPDKTPMDAQQLEPQTSDAQLAAATGQAADAEQVDGSLEQTLTGKPAALIPDEALNGVAEAAVAPAGTRSSKPALRKAFSLLERDSAKVDQKDVSNMQKVLVIGKISQAAVVAASAYKDQEAFQKQTGITKSCLIDDKLHRNTKVHVGWLEGGTAVFAFRGTATAQDGMQDVKIFSKNIDYLQELYPGVKAHLGFIQQFAAVCNPERSDTNLAAVLKELSGGCTPTRVICCGHSLGGALATLGAAWSALEYPDADVRCITFGSPRVANRVFGKAFSALVGTSLRVVHGFDPIPALPPSLLYHHVPGAIHIKRENMLLQRPPWHTFFRASVADHGMSRYHVGIYRHMPGGLGAMPWLWRHRPATVCKLAAKKRQTEEANAAGKSSSLGKSSFLAGCWQGKAVKADKSMADRDLRSEDG